jgi:MFS family permease
LTQPFRVGDRPKIRSTFGDYTERTDLSNYILGLPDGLIYTIKSIFSGNWFNIVFRVLTIVYAYSAAGPFGLIFAAPVCGAILYLVFWLVCHLLYFVAMPIIAFALLITPSICYVVLLHMPVHVLHKEIDEYVEGKGGKEGSE